MRTDLSNHDSLTGKSRFERVQLHGVLVRVLETGALLIGESGIGKSECALDLVSKGHQLVADDVIEVRADADGLTGRAPELTSDLLEIRGLGIINVRDLFGETSVCTESAIDLCVEFQRNTDVERIGNVIGEQDVAGRRIPKFVLPVSSGRNLSTLVETAARLYLNRKSAPDAGEVLIKKHRSLLDRTR